MRAESSAWQFCSVETSPRTRKSQSFVDSDNNYALFLSRLRYFDVSTHLSLHVERRTRVFHCRNKPRHTQIAIIRRFWQELYVKSLPFNIFRRLNPLFTASCVPNIVHTFSSVVTSPDTCKSQSFVDIVKIYALFLSRSRYFVVSTHLSLHAERSARVFHCRNKPRHTKIAIIHRFWRQLCAISLPFEIFRRLNALFTALCVQIVVHALSSVETSPDTSKSQSFVDFVQIYA